MGTKYVSLNDSLYNYLSGWRSIAHQWAAGFSNLADLGLATVGLNPRFQTIPAAVLALARQGKPAGS